MERKAYATVQAHESYLTLHILPKWQDHRLSEVKTVAVEEWLESLELTPTTKTKLRNIMSAVYSHGIRHEWISFNPISKVRCSAKRLREPDVLTPGEFQALLRELPLRERVMVMIAGSTGLRRSELFALRWSDVNFFTMEIAVTRSCVRNHFGDTKTDASRKPVPLHETVCDVLAEWRGASLYKGDDDFLFPSLRMNGTQPLMPDMILKKAIRPALTRANITGKVIGWLASGTAWQPTSAVWEWMSRLHKSYSGTQIYAPRWTSIRKQFPQTSGVRVRGRLRCCWHECGMV